MSNSDLIQAKSDKMDEFYTTYEDIQKEVQAYVEYDPDAFRDKVVLCPCDDPDRSQFFRFFKENFETLGLKGLISSCYNGKGPQYSFDDFDNIFVNGKYLRMFREGGDIKSERGFLKGSGDFRSAEVCGFRDESDIIITNPPFSLFRDFLRWSYDAGKEFIIMGNLNAISCKEIFPLVRTGSVRLGPSIHSGDRKFIVPEEYRFRASGCGVDDDGNRYIKVKGVRWYTNMRFVDHNVPLKLHTAQWNLENNARLKKTLRTLYESDVYPDYDNYDAIEVPITECIPSDYDGVMGVPISFMDRFDPEKFEIVDMGKRGAGDPNNRTRIYTKDDSPQYGCLNAGPVIKCGKGLVMTYLRVLIRHRR